MDTFNKAAIVVYEIYLTFYLNENVASIGVKRVFSPSRSLKTWQSRHVLLPTLSAPLAFSWRPACRPTCSSWTLPRFHLSTVHGKKNEFTRETSYFVFTDKRRAREKNVLCFRAQVNYLKECHPREFIITLHGVSEVVLQRPELSVQVVVDWDGTERKVWHSVHSFKHSNKQKCHLNKKRQTSLCILVCDGHIPRCRSIVFSHFSFLHLHTFLLFLCVL